MTEVLVIHFRHPHEGGSEGVRGESTDENRGMSAGVIHVRTAHQNSKLIVSTCTMYCSKKIILISVYVGNGTTNNVLVSMHGPVVKMQLKV